jgi:hypothetical protein
VEVAVGTIEEARAGSTMMMRVDISPQRDELSLGLAEE